MKQTHRSWLSDSMHPVVDFRLFQNVLDNLATAVLLLDKSRKLVYINTAGEMIFAESSRQLLGSSAKDLFKGCKGVIEEDLARCLETGTSLSERNIVLEMLEHPVTVNFLLLPYSKVPNRPIFWWKCIRWIAICVSTGKNSYWSSNMRHEYCCGDWPTKSRIRWEVCGGSATIGSGIG